MNPLSIFKPDAHTIEMLTDSMWYIAKKDDFTIFLEVFFEYNDDDDDEAIVTIYEKDNHLPSYGGTLEGCLEHIKRYLVI